MVSPLSFSNEHILAVLSLSKNATAIYITDDIVIQWANDAMLAFWGKERSVIGLPLEEAVPELKGQPFKKMLQDVLKTGVTNAGDSIPAELMVDGKLQISYYNYEYRAITDEKGQPYCILHTAADVTEKILNRKALQKAKELEELQKRALTENERNLRLVILQAPVAIAIFRGPNYVVEIVNSRALELWGRKEKDVLNKPILKAMSELEAQGIKGLLDHVYQTGEPFSAIELPVLLLRNKQMETAYINFVYEPLYDLDGTINGLITIGTDVTQQVQARKDIEWAEEQLRLAIDSADLATWYLDLATGEFFPSAKLKELFGYYPDEDMPLNAAIDQITDEYREQVRSAVEATVNTGANYHMEYPAVGYRDKKMRWLKAMGKVYHDESTQTGNFFGVIIEITESKLDELRKNDFIGMASHELKTPLTSLTAIVQVLNNKLKNNDDAFIAGALDKANTQVKKMSSMINGFLNISRFESGKIQIIKQEFDLAELVLEMVKEAELTTSTHQIKLEDCKPIKINADRDKIGSVISNLLSNAVKYSPKGKLVTIECHLDKTEVTVSITDEGMGIKPHDREKLFERYYRVQTNHTQHISGFGIGLYLSAEIIKRHDGKNLGGKSKRRWFNFLF